jgi:hypothetical protein
LWNRFLHRLHLARELSLLDWLALAESWWVLLVFHWRLRWVNYEHLAQTTVPGVKNTGLCHDKPGMAISSRLAVAQRLHRLVGWASHLHLLKMTCLPQSLALRWMLNRRGITSDLKLGAMKTRIGIHAHAWVEIEGEVIGDEVGAEKGFNIFDSVN